MIQVVVGRHGTLTRLQPEEMVRAIPAIICQRLRQSTAKTSHTALKRGPRGRKLSPAPLPRHGRARVATASTGARTNARSLALAIRISPKMMSVRAKGGRAGGAGRLACGIGEGSPR